MMTKNVDDESGVRYRINSKNWVYASRDAATVWDKDMNMIYMCKDDQDPELRKAIYIGEGGQVTTLNRRSPSRVPERSLIL